MQISSSLFAEQVGTQMHHLHSHRSQLLITACAASLLTATLLSAYTTWDRAKRRKELERETHRALAAQPSSNGPAPPPTKTVTENGVGITGPVEYTEELIREQLARNYTFFGEDSMGHIRCAKVVVVGCGGVGSWAAVMLVRSGVSNIRLVDFDYVTLSSLNRHATAGHTDVGTPKVKCIEKALKQIAPWVEVDSRVAIWRKEDAEGLLQGADWVVDAIDNISTKVDLLKYCHDNSIKVFSSMGAGAKSDPTRIQISDISTTIYDPLARAVRRRLRLQGVSSGIPVVYSTEVPGEVKLLPLPEEEFAKGNVKELGVFDDFRVRILPVLGPLPSIFGLNIATYILCELAQKPIPNPLRIKNRSKLYERLLRDLCTRESQLTGDLLNKLPIDEEDVALIFEDVYRGRSLIPPHDIPVKPVLVRWDPAKKLDAENCVAMELRECEKHIRECFVGGRRPLEVWGEEVARIVRSRQAEIVLAREWAM